VTPGSTPKLTRLCTPTASSLLATTLSCATFDPRYAASSVSKLLPAVSIVIVPAPGAVQCHHSEAPPVLPA
jgi:hypothetical protein